MIAMLRGWLAEACRAEEQVFGSWGVAPKLGEEVKKEGYVCWIKGQVAVR